MVLRVCKKLHCVDCYYTERCNMQEFVFKKLKNSKHYQQNVKKKQFICFVKDRIVLQRHLLKLACLPARYSRTSLNSTNSPPVLQGPSQPLGPLASCTIYRADQLTAIVKKHLCLEIISGVLMTLVCHILIRCPTSFHYVPQRTSKHSGNKLDHKHYSDFLRTIFLALWPEIQFSIVALICNISLPRGNWTKYMTKMNKSI